MFDPTDLQRVALSAMAAIILTTVSVGAAVGPARAVETGPLLAAASQTVQAHV